MKVSHEQHFGYNIYPYYQVPSYVSFLKCPFKNTQFSMETPGGPGGQFLFHLDAESNLQTELLHI